MNFDFSEEQKLLQEEVIKVLSEEASYRRLRIILDEGKSFDDHLWRLAGDLGWLGAAIEEEYDGTGMTPLELCVVAEALGSYAGSIPYTSSIGVVAEAIRLGENQELKRQLLPRLASGEVIGCFAFTRESQSVRDEVPLRVDNGVVSGEIWPVMDGPVSRYCLINGDSGQKDSLFLIDLNNVGANVEPLESFDPLRPMAKLTLEKVRCERLGGGGGLYTKVFSRAATLKAFEQIGGAQSCLQMATSYVGERYAFGRPIGANQSVKHKLAEMLVRIEMARSNAYFAAWAMKEDSEKFPLAAAVARLSAIEAYEYASRECLQLHGGIGFTWEANCHFHYRRSRSLALELGTYDEWASIITNHLDQPA